MKTILPMNALDAACRAFYQKSADSCSFDEISKAEEAVLGAMKVMSLDAISLVRQNIPPSEHGEVWHHPGKHPAGHRVSLCSPELCGRNPRDNYL